jgi:hypothetical protein
MFVWQAILDSPASYMPQMLAGTSVINSVQGRYFIPLAPLLLAACSGVLRRRFAVNAATPGFCLAVAITASLTAFFCLGRTYYSPAGTTARVSRIALGVYRSGRWILNSYTARGNQVFEPQGYQPGDIPVTGDWNGDGRASLGVYRHGLWILDSNGDQQFDRHDVSFYFGGLAGDLPVAGDWNGDGRFKAGIYREGLWLLDVNGARSERDARVFAFGGLPHDVPLAGDWNGARKSKVAIYRNGLWILDVDGRETESQARVVAFGGLPGDVPVAGDWEGNRKSHLGIFRQGSWILDLDGDCRMDPANDREYTLGSTLAGDIPVVLASH